MRDICREYAKKAIAGFRISFKPTEIPGKSGEYFKVFVNGEELGTVRRSGRGSATRYQLLGAELYAAYFEGSMRFFYPKDEMVEAMLKGMINRSLMDDPLYKAQLESKKESLTSELIDLSEGIKALSSKAEEIYDKFKQSNIEGSLDVWSAMRYLDSAARELLDVAKEICPSVEAEVA